MRRLLLALVLACAWMPRPAGAAGHIYIDAAEFSACDGVHANATQRNIATAGYQPFTVWEFDSTVDSCVFAHAWFPEDNTSNAFTPTIYFRTANMTAFATVRVAVGLVANPESAIYGNITGLEGISSNVVGYTEANSSTDNYTKVATAGSAYSVWNKNTGANCVGSTCRNTLLTIRLERICSVTHCTAAGVPWYCCTGNNAGTCVAGNDSGVTYQMEGIDLAY